jgi:hypothetical protein
MISRKQDEFFLHAIPINLGEIISDYIVKSGVMLKIL